MNVQRTKIFIASIPFSASDDDLRGHLGQLGLSPKKVFITFDKETGRSRGFGFAEFGSETEAEAAIKTIERSEMNGRLLGAAWANQQGGRR